MSTSNTQFLPNSKHTSRANKLFLMRSKEMEIPRHDIGYVGLFWSVKSGPCGHYESEDKGSG